MATMAKGTAPEAGGLAPPVGGEHARARQRRAVRGAGRTVGVVALICALVLAAVGPAAAAGPPGGSGGGHGGRGAVPLDVATYNLYLGADLTPLFGVTDPAELGPVAAGVWAEVHASRPAERLAAVADVVARHRPDVVGLQEVALWEAAPYRPGERPPGPADYEPVYDFLGLLLDALAARGTPYEAVAVQQNFTSAALPVPVSATEAVRFTDRDVILVRTATLDRAEVSAAGGGTFAARFSAQVAGASVDVIRGWAQVDLTVRGRTMRIFNTHLEAYGAPPLQDQIRNPQAVELAAQVTASPHPVVVVGDINARPTMCTAWRQPTDPRDANVVAYATLEDAGLREVWPLTHRRAPCGPEGWTSGQDDLLGPSTLDHRIDVVFIDEAFTALCSRVVGDEERERSEPTGLWPSDHAATIARIRLDAAPAGGPPPGGHPHRPDRGPGARR